MTERIFRYLREQQPETPCLVVDLDVVENNFRRMRELLPAAHIFYAVKANPAAQILTRLATAGSKFDTASRGVELGARGRQARQDLRGRVGLHGVEDVRRRQQFAHAAEVVLDHVEIDHQARRLGLLLSEITQNTLGHCWGVPRLTVGLFEKVST